jgi:F-type H+-transporting ATPase subunit delta
MNFLDRTCKSSIDFLNLLKSPVVSSEKKDAILSAITKGKVSELTAAFNRLLVTKAREASLPEIVTAFITQYNQIKGIHKVKLTTAIPVSDDVKDAIVDKIRRETEIQTIELETKLNESLIGGFVLEFDNKLVDASVARDLRDVKAQFNKNIFERQIR